MKAIDTVNLLTRKQFWDELDQIIWEVDVLPGGKFRFLLFNNKYKEIVGVGHEEMAGKTLSEALPPTDAISVGARYSQCVSDRTKISYSEYLSIGNRWRWWRTTLTPKLNSSGQVYRLMGVATEIESLESELRNALRRKQLAVHYQKIVCLRTDQVAGYEALVRWPESGYSPNDFLPVAKVSGFMGELTQYVLDEVCETLGKIDPALWVAVNLSGFLKGESIHQTIAGHGVNPDRLRFEITEDTEIDSSVIQGYHQIIELGHVFELDDYGTERSGPAWLERLQFGAIKIDARFVRNAWCTPNKAAVCEAARVLAERFSPRLQVISEGVETAEDLTFIKTMGADYGQGYFWGRPGPLVS